MSARRLNRRAFARWLAASPTLPTPRVTLPRNTITTRKRGNIAYRVWMKLSGREGLVL